MVPLLYKYPNAVAIPPHAGQGIGMALEDAYLLSRLLKKRYDLGHIFQEYDTIRRTRINMFAKMAHRGGDMRRETGAWA
jgi:2-polyprenyl-6-methoxyphenol hydroxylase-like FAD-dependent oxidoreductase